MFHAVLDRAAVALLGVSPPALRKKLLMRARHHLMWATVDVYCEAAFFTRSAEAKFDALQLAFGSHDCVPHRNCAVRLVVGEPGRSRYQRQGHQLTNENDRAPSFSTDGASGVEAK